VITPLPDTALPADEPDLFGHFDIALPCGYPSGGKPRLQLVWSRQDEPEEDSGQFELALPNHPERRIVDFVCARRRHYLNYAIRDLSRRSPALRHAGRLLSRKGVHFLGDMLACERGYLVHVVGLDYAEVRAFDELLSAAGLHTDMLVPNWVSPFSRTG
jgi:hypothetical protein